MNVLSLFDGMSCGQIALNRIGIKPDKYFASEIDKYAIKITQKNYPNTIQIGDVTKVSYKDGILYTENGNFEIENIDLVMGGSPCQGFSNAGKGLNFDDPRSKLFFEFVRILNEVKSTYFLLENVKMKKDYQNIISEYLNVEPILINSALVSAQDRKRLYWTNIKNVKQPKDKHIYLKDVLINKDFVIDQNDSNKILIRRRGHEYFIIKNDYKDLFRIEPSMIKAIENKKCKILTDDDKSHTCTTKQRRWNNSGFIYDENKLRYLHPIECERLQTIPDNYTEGVSNTQRYKMLGNGWTIDVICHILKNMVIL